MKNKNQNIENYEKLFYNAKEISNMLGVHYRDITALFHLAGIKKKWGYYVKKERLKDFQNTILELVKKIKSFI